MMKNVKLVSSSLVLAAMGIIPSSWAQQSQTLTSRTQQMGQFSVSVEPVDSSKTTVRITVNEAGKPVTPGVVPLKVEYVARNVPFTPVDSQVSGTSLLVQVPSSLTESYTLRVNLQWDRSTHQRQFFINRGNQQGGR